MNEPDEDGVEATILRVTKLHSDECVQGSYLWYHRESGSMHRILA